MKDHDCTRCRRCLRFRSVDLNQGPRRVGVRLAATPVALGLLSPLAGALYDRAGARLLTASGMVLSLCAFAALILTLDGRPQTFFPVTAALALFGVGQGLFTSPNNSSIMGAAPPDSVGQASGILNVTRSFGTSVGVAAASVILAWRLDVFTGRAGQTLHAPSWALLDAAHDVILAFALFALVAGVLSWSRPHRHRRRAEIVPVGDGPPRPPSMISRRSRRRGQFTQKAALSRTKN
jgi:MFS family permease